ncbi:MAG: hypothetical protein M1831_007413, partial [Alyxoria varia]
DFRLLITRDETIAVRSLLLELRDKMVETRQALQKVSLGWLEDGQLFLALSAMGMIWDSVIDALHLALRSEGLRFRQFSSDDYKGQRFIDRLRDGYSFDGRLLAGALREVVEHDGVL